MNVLIFFILALSFFEIIYSATFSMYIHKYASKIKHASRYLQTVEQSSIECAIRCLQRGEGCSGDDCKAFKPCKGFQFDGQTCKMFEGKKRKKEEIQWYNTPKHSDKPGKFGWKCKEHDDCTFNEGFCLEGTCTCIIGYSYDFNKDTCVTRCPKYGNTFSKYRNSGIKECNVIVQNAKNAGTCEEFCVIEKTFECISAEFFLGKCKLCNKTWADLPDKVKQVGTKPAWSLLYRHCN